MTDCSNDWLVQHGTTATENIDVVSAADFDPGFQTVVDTLWLDESPSGHEPTHLQTMRDKGFFDYDDTGEPGQLRTYPRGKILRRLLTEFVEGLFCDTGSMSVATPTMYEVTGPVEHHADAFRERQYRFTSNGREMMLRFAADFGHFSLLRDAHLSENRLPLSLHEICRYAYRREQSGELVGLYRLRSFTMPDMHTLVQNRRHALDQFTDQLQLIEAVEDAMQLSYQGILRLTESFYDTHQSWVETLSQHLDRPLLIQKLGDQHSYWTAKLDFAFVDGYDHIVEGPTIQLDLDTAERFDISVTDGTDTYHPVLLHTSPTGSIERLSATLLEAAMLDRNPHLPAWLAPTQVRLIPVAERHLEMCHEIADQLEAKQIRVEVDDREVTVGRGVKDAEEDWAAFYVVIGDDELEDGTLRAHMRSRNEEHEVSVATFPPFIDEHLGDRPRLPHSMPRQLSEHVQFGA